MALNTARACQSLAALIAALGGGFGIDGSAAASPPDEASAAEEARWSADVDRVNSLPAWQWLNAHRYSGTMTTLDGAIVHFVGYFRPEDLNLKLLAQFNEGPLSPEISVPRVPFKPTAPVRVMLFPVPGHSGMECAALVQVRLEPNRPDAAKEAARVVDS